ncbi:glycosyltransferase family 2 protein [Mycobacterium sp. 1164985.4]|uniref:glycosyltransferase family 2 protein n=1 Tax=Mycobacterium sp. 1164985.4 TaxID=1834069 RepID=UPI0007FC74A4|nr:glycosyltransferase family 2 protein [Mycobacterium sp. 1164985.4]OBK81695.1 hypothetical protein A5650_25175 [Mycobacterium sp. 1164985.4]
MSDKGSGVDDTVESHTLDASQPGVQDQVNQRYVLGPDGSPLIGSDGKPIIERRRPKSERRPPNPRVSVVVPAKNEAANIREILPYLENFHEVIVVVSEGDDESAAAAREALPKARVIHQTRKGKGNALACGFREVTGDAIVMFDVDGSADPHEIPRFIKALTDGADLAKGSRFCEGGGSKDITRIRSAGNWGLNLLASVLTNTRFTDLCYGYNAFWADQLYMLDLPSTDLDAPEMVRGDGFEIEALIIGRFALSGAAITEVPSLEHERYHGTTNLNTFKDGFRVLWTILQDRLYARQIRKLSKRRHVGNVPGPARPGWMRDEMPLDIRRVKRLDTV